MANITIITCKENSEDLGGGIDARMQMPGGENNMGDGIKGAETGIIMARTQKLAV